MIWIRAFTNLHKLSNQLIVLFHTVQLSTVSFEPREGVEPSFSVYKTDVISHYTNKARVSIFLSKVYNLYAYVALRLSEDLQLRICSSEDFPGLSGNTVSFSGCNFTSCYSLKGCPE